MKYRLITKAALFLTAAFASLLPFTPRAQRVLTLKEAIDLSVKNSKQLKNNFARVEEATAALKEAVQAKLPNAEVSGSYLRLNNPHIVLKTKSTTSPSTSDPAKPSSVLYGIANVTMPVYSGSRIRYGIESSRYLAEAAKLDADFQREEVILNTINAYNNLYKSKAAADLVKENLEGARQRVKDFTNLEKNGLLPRNDLLKAELQESNIELALLDAENNWKLASINMNLMIGLPDTTTLTVGDGELQNKDITLKPVEDYVQLGLQNRKDVAALALRKKAAATGIKAAKGGALPSLALTAGYVAAEVPGVLTVINAVNIGVGVRYSLSSLWKNGSIDQAKAREKQVAANQEMMQDAIRLQVNEAYQSYLLSLKRIEVLGKAVAQADENYKIVRNKFDNALSTTTDLIDADVARLQARLNKANAGSDAVAAYDKLLQTTGQLTGNE